MALFGASGNERRRPRIIAITLKRALKKLFSLSVIALRNIALRIRVRITPPSRKQTKSKRTTLAIRSDTS